MLTAQDGFEARARLAEVLTEPAAARAREAGLATIVVLDTPGAGGEVAATALRAAGGFAFTGEARLVAVGTRERFSAALGRCNGEGREVLRELLRAYDASSTGPRRLRWGRYSLDLNAGAKVIGILNVTPDSFHDGGAYRSVDRARERAAEMVALGAHAIDIGGRSYAAGNAVVGSAEERKRVLPVVEALVRDGLGVPLSVDTIDSGLAEAALAAGADAINDCSGLADERLASAVAAHGGGLVVMHLRGRLNVREPDRYCYRDAVGEISAFLREGTQRAIELGVLPDAIVVDPGFEFGKEPHTDLEILARFGDFRSLGYPLLLAVSRKSFIGRIFERPPSGLLVPSLAAAALGVAAGANFVRAHDVRETADVVKMLAAVRHGV